MPETIGQRLKRAREDRHLTLEEAAEATRIRLQYLQALEADDFSVMPSPVQGRGFLRNYADYLGLNLEQILAELHSAPPTPPPQEVIFEGEVSPVAPSEAIAPVLQPADSRSEKEDRPASRRTRRTKAPARPEPLPAPAPEAGPSPHVSSASDESAPPAVPSTSEGRAALSAALQAGAGWLKSRFSRPKQSIEGQTAPPESEAVTESPLPASSPVLAERPSPAQEIFNFIGQQLRERREVLGLSLDEIERYTRLRAQLLAALEEGRMEALPSPLQTRGMLSSYATFLDLDVDALLLRFADALQAQHRERYPDRNATPRQQGEVISRLPSLRMVIAGDLIFGMGMFILLIVFVGWGILQVAAIRSERQAAQATAPSISDVLIGTPEVTAIASATPIPVEDTPLPTLEGTLEIPTLSPSANVQVNLVAVERSYLRVLVDGKVVFEGRTTPGTLYPFEAEQSIEVLAGNGAALQVIYNQRDLGLLGGFGQLAHYVYTIDQILVPTPAASLTPTLTPFVTPTPSVTPSPTPSPTLPPAGDSL